MGGDHLIREKKQRRRRGKGSTEANAAGSKRKGNKASRYTKGWSEVSKRKLEKNIWIENYSKISEDTTNVSYFKLVLYCSVSRWNVHFV